MVVFTKVFGYQTLRKSRCACCGLLCLDFCVKMVLEVRLIDEARYSSFCGTAAGFSAWHSCGHHTAQSLSIASPAWLWQHCPSALVIVNTICPLLSPTAHGFIFFFFFGKLSAVIAAVPTFHPQCLKEDFSKRGYLPPCPRCYLPVITAVWAG